MSAIVLDTLINAARLYDLTDMPGLEFAVRTAEHARKMNSFLRRMDKRAALGEVLTEQQQREEADEFHELMAEAKSILEEVAGGEGGTSREEG